MGVDFTGSEAWIQDKTSSPIYSFGGNTGSKIYLRGTSVDISHENFVNARPKTMIDETVDSSNNESTIGDENNYSRRKGEVTYQGFENPVINVGGIIHLDEARVGSIAAGTVIATPGVLRRFWVNPKKYHFFDPKIVDTITNDPFSSTPDPYSSNNSVPVTIQALSFSDTADSNIITYELTLREDTKA